MRFTAPLALAALLWVPASAQVSPIGEDENWDVEMIEPETKPNRTWTLDRDPNLIGSLPDAEPIAPATAQPELTFEDAYAAFENEDYALALIQGKVAGSAGDADAQTLVGHILMRGQSGIIDTVDAARWLKLAAAQDHPDALMALGELGATGQAGLTRSDATVYYRRAADLGRTDAMTSLAALLDGGPVPNADAANGWLKAAADGGDAEAARLRAERLIDSDPVAALDALQQAADMGSAEAAYAAAILLVENVDIRPDERRAAALLRQAAEGGVAPAMADYGLVIYQGAGVDRDIEAAAKWFERAAEAGDVEGQFLYAYTLAKGDGVPQDYEAAYYWLLKSGGDTGVPEYDVPRRQLREKLEDNVDIATLAAARARAGL